MKSLSKVLLVSFMFVNFSCGLTMSDVLEAAEEISSSSGLTQERASEGLKEALKVGIKAASATAGKQDGFYKNQLIKISFPPQIAEVETKLRGLGLDAQVDKFVLKLNRAAENASKQAAPIFIDAIKEMSMSDALSILKGADNQATSFLKEKTTDKLKAAFKPVIDKSLQEVKLNQVWTPLVTAYNAIPLTDNVNPDLEDYINNRAIAGLFTLLEKEEAKIRNNPGARVNDLLKEVFAYQD